MNQRNASVPDPETGTAVEATRRGLPLNATREARGIATARTWTVRLPVRAERVIVTKPVVVSESVTIDVHPTTETVTLSDGIRREELHIVKSGHPVVHDAEPRPGQ